MSEPIAEFELRASSNRASVDRTDGRRIRGQAIVFNSLSRIMMHNRIGKFREVIRPEAVDRTLRQGSSVKALWNHNDDLVLGNTRSGTLILRKTSTALAIEIDPPSWAESYLETIQRGDVDGMSFRFRSDADGEEWDPHTKDGIPIRTITDMEFTEISVTPFPVYEATNVQMSQRSLDLFAKVQAETMGRSVDWWQKWHRTQLAR